MLSRELKSNKLQGAGQKRIILAAAIALFIVVAAAATFSYLTGGCLILSNGKTGEEYARFNLREGGTFSVGFIHSVNKSPVTDYYELREDGIYVVKTVYYGFGAGVQTELEEGETLTYGEDGSMIITGFNRKMEDLIYFVGTVSDHTMVINEGREDEQQVSLRDLCGRNAMVRFTWEPQGDALTD